MFHPIDTDIIACATNTTSNSALAVIRLSGTFKLLDFKNFFNKNISDLKPRTVKYINLIDPIDGSIVDDVVVTYFQAPNSYTGQNLLEISCHGNSLIVKKIINLFTEKAQFVEAYPGEFSYRALKNKKINLIQAEGLDLILNGKNSLALAHGRHLISGHLFSQFDEIRKSYEYLATQIEIFINFSEDVGDDDVLQAIKLGLINLVNNLEGLIKINQSSVQDFILPQVSLSGYVNVGKSTFYNALLGRDRSIVTDIEGTTTDFISERININGNQFELVDTAGIRDTDSIIEMEGISRGRAIFEKSFFKIFIIKKIDENLINQNSSSDLFIITHEESLSEVEKQKIEHYFKNKKLKFLFTDIISLKNNKNLSQINHIKSQIFNMIDFKFQNLMNGHPLVLPRHNKIIKDLGSAFEEIQGISSEMNKQGSLDIAILDFVIKKIAFSLDELIGISSPERVLENIFSNYCIGK